MDRSVKLYSFVKYIILKLRFHDKTRMQPYETACTYPQLLQ